MICSTLNIYYGLLFQLGDDLGQWDTGRQVSVRGQETLLRRALERVKITLEAESHSRTPSWPRDFGGLDWAWEWEWGWG